MILDKFLLLLKASLNPQANMPTLKLTDSEWTQLYDMSMRQNTTALLSVGIERLDVASRPPENLTLLWLLATECVRRRNVTMNRASAAICIKLVHDGFHVCLLKGQGVATYYPDPSLRMAGDIDLWVDHDRDEFIAYIREHFHHPCIRYRDVNVFVSNDIEVEFHFTPAVFNNYFRNHKLQEFFQANKAAQFRNYTPLGTDIEAISPTPQFNRIYLITHMFNHYLYEGIGLRQFIDYYYLLSRGFTEEEKRHDVCTLRRLGLAKFAAATMYVLHNFLGLEEKFLLLEPDAHEGQRLMSEIIKGGNFGKYNNGYKKQMTYSLATLFRHLERNTRYASTYPTEALSAPLFKIWHYCYRKSKGYI